MQKKNKPTNFRELPPLPQAFEERLKECKETDKVPVIILTTGSFCPIHKGHLYSLSDSKKFLEQNFNYKVISVYISPSNNSYVYSKSIRHKFMEYYLTFSQRCELLDKTLQIMTKNKEVDEDMFIIDKWEGEHEKFIDFPTVWHILYSAFEKLFNERKYKLFKIFYSVGSDMIYRTEINMYRPWAEMALLITERELEKESDEIKTYRELYIRKSFKEMEKINIYYLMPSKNYEKYSSTLLRECIEKNFSNESGIKYEDLIYKEIGDKIKEFYEINRNFDAKKQNKN